MTQVGATDTFMPEPLLALLAPAAPAGPRWLESARAQAAAKFRELGLPTTRHEQWRKTNLQPVGALTYTRPAPAHGYTRQRLNNFNPAVTAAATLVFVNGHFDQQLSTVPATRGFTVRPLAAAIAADAPEAKQHLGRLAALEADALTALNTACFTDGAVVQIGPETIVDDPIVLLFITDAGQAPAITFPRLLVTLGQSAQARVVEVYGGQPGGAYFTNAVTEIALADNARLEHLKLQRESTADFHVGTLAAKLQRNANFVSHVVNFGGAIVRNNIDVLLAGEGAESTLNGLTVISGNQHVDNHTMLDHAQPHCPSHELYKAVLEGASSGVFRGKILVRPGAQKTDAKQNSKTLLLSDGAVMDSQPQLEIYADDVKCTHGSTTGPVDDEQVFYLRARGVPLAAARALLTYAFAADVLNRITHEPLRSVLEHLAREALHQQAGPHGNGAL
jgi:Fe-S cluster assembly protein SufD